MKIIHAIQMVKNNQILVNLPPEFAGKEVEITVSIREPSQKRKKSLRGALAMYANPARRSLESRAWEMVIEEKYADR